MWIVDIFEPLFEVTRDPTTHPELHIFLQRVIGFDSVDDESKAERRIYRKFPLPKDWTTDQNRSSLFLSPVAPTDVVAAAPYAYWLYYLFSNITSLNNWRFSRGFSASFLSSVSLCADSALVQIHSGSDRTLEKLEIPII